MFPAVVKFYCIREKVLRSLWCLRGSCVRIISAERSEAAVEVSPTLHEVKLDAEVAKLGKKTSSVGDCISARILLVPGRC